MNDLNIFSRIVKVGLISLVLIRCSSSDPEPVIDGSCSINKVIRESTRKNPVTMFHPTGLGADTVFYYSQPGEALINYTTYLYNDRGNVTQRQIFDVNNVLENQVTINYWSGGRVKFQKVERKKLETLYDQTNTRQESSFDEHGNIVLYKNFSNNNDLMNHLTYTNQYEDGLLIKAIRDDKLYSFGGTTEYTYNASGLKILELRKDASGGITGKREFTYNSNNHLIKIANYVEDVLANTERYILNNEGVTLKLEMLASDDKVHTTHTFQYDCK